MRKWFLASNMMEDYRARHQLTWERAFDTDNMQRAFWFCLMILALACWVNMAAMYAISALCALGIGLRALKSHRLWLQRAATLYVADELRPYIPMMIPVYGVPEALILRHTDYTIKVLALEEGLQAVVDEQGNLKGFSPVEVKVRLEALMASDRVMALKRCSELLLLDNAELERLMRIGA